MDLSDGIVAASERLQEAGAADFLLRVTHAGRADAFFAALARSIDKPAVAFQCCHALRTIFSKHDTHCSEANLQTAMSLFDRVCSHPPAASSVPALADAVSYLAIKCTTLIPDAPARVLRAAAALGQKSPAALVELCTVIARLSRVYSRFLPQKLQRASAECVRPAWPAIRDAMQHVFHSPSAGPALRDRVVGAVAEWIKMGCGPDATRDPWVRSLVSTGSADLIDALLRAGVDESLQRAISEHLLHMALSPSVDEDARARAAASLCSICKHERPSPASAAMLVRMLGHADRDVADEAVDAIAYIAERRDEDSDASILPVLFPACVHALLFQASRPHNYARLDEDCRERVDQSARAALDTLAHVAREFGVEGSVWSVLRAVVSELQSTPPPPPPPAAAAAADEDREGDRASAASRLGAAMRAVSALAADMTTMPLARDPLFDRAPLRAAHAADEDTFCILRALMAALDAGHADAARPISKLCCWAARHDALVPVLAERLLRAGGADAAKGVARLIRFCDPSTAIALQLDAALQRNSALSCMAMLAAMRGPEDVMRLLRPLLGAGSLDSMCDVVRAAGSKNPRALEPLLPALVSVVRAAAPDRVEDAARMLRHAIEACALGALPALPDLLGLAADMLAAHVPESIGIICECMAAFRDRPDARRAIAQVASRAYEVGRSADPEACMDLVRAGMETMGAEFCEHSAVRMAIADAIAAMESLDAGRWEQVAPFLCDLFSKCAAAAPVGRIVAPLFRIMCSPDDKWADAEPSPRGIFLLVCATYPDARDALLSAFAAGARDGISTLRETFEERMCSFLSAMEEGSDADEALADVLEIIHQNAS